MHPTKTIQNEFNQFSVFIETKVNTIVISFAHSDLFEWNYLSKNIKIIINGSKPIKIRGHNLTSELMEDQSKTWPWEGERGFHHYTIFCCVKLFTNLYNQKRLLNKTMFGMFFFQKVDLNIQLIINNGIPFMSNRFFLMLIILQGLKPFWH